MFMDDIAKDGKIFPRFTKIVDKNIISELEIVREEDARANTFKYSEQYKDK